MAHLIQGNDRKELELPEALTHVLDECRMVLPGIQALFGFQMIAVFNNGFADRLTTGQQKLHILAIVLVVIAIVLVMSPASLHREAEPKTASDRFLRVATRLLLAAMLPLAAGICLDVFLVAFMVWKDPVIPTLLAVMLFICFVTLWFCYPPIYRRRSRRGAA
jgi:hypothetical protein